MKTIDLHCHTKATKSGDAKSRNVTPDDFAKEISCAGIEIAAITNHNLFDLDQFRELVAATDGIAQVWPGVELDVKRGGERWHMLVVCNPDSAEEFSSRLSQLVNGLRPDDVLLEFDDIWEAFLPVDALFISHAHKEPGISERAMREIISQAGREKWRLFFEPTSLLSVGIMANHGLNMIIGSDVQNWKTYSEDYNEDKRCVLRLDVDGFRQFCLLAQRDEAVVDTLLNSRESRVMRVFPHKDVSFMLPIYQDVNVIFGQKGTGKTEIVQSLLREYEHLGIKCSTYSGGQKASDFDRLLDTSDMKREPGKFGRSNCEDEIKRITEWTDEAPIPIDKYRLWLTTRSNSKKKKRFKLSESQELPQVTTGSYEKTRKDACIAGKFVSDFEAQRLGKYLLEEEGAVLEKLLKKLSALIHDEKEDQFVNLASIDMANTALGQIKSLIDKKSETVSKPGKCGLHSFVTRRIELHTLVKNVLDNLSPDKRESPAYLGQLEDKGALSLISRWRYLTDGRGSVAGEYSASGTKISDLRKWRNALKNIITEVFSEDLPDAIAEFAKLSSETGITSLDKFIGTSKFIRIDGQSEEYAPSDGEKGILLLERRLNAEADVYLLDEPENGMSNLYIDSIIRPIIIDLARKRRTVVIATHNANLAVRTLPYQSVYREHVQGEEYRTYLGNPFTNRLCDLNKQAEDIGWAERSMRTLEGGEEAFYSRKTIYEAGE